jgi:putative transposase
VAQQIRVIRRDNGPANISEPLEQWSRNHGIEIAFIQPGNPQQNTYVEPYNRAARDDWLEHHLFSSISEVQNFAMTWPWTCNHEQPNIALSGINPKQNLAMVA